MAGQVETEQPQLRPQPLPLPDELAAFASQSVQQHQRRPVGGSGRFSFGRGQAWRRFRVDVRHRSRPGGSQQRCPLTKLIAGLYVTLWQK
ncbi:hypothetical protein GCM10010176_084480 [Nonomuraea spiralis]|nr:hypothetical protein GCM10010176_084480 [Nonomuraea spiralis]